MVLALLTKESAFILPIVLLAYTLIFVGGAGKKKATVLVGGLVVLVFLFWGGRTYCLRRTVERYAFPYPHVLCAGKALYLPRILLTYTGLTVFPLTLKSEYHFVVRSIRDPYVWAGMPFLAALFFFTAKTLRPKKPAVFALWWVLLGDAALLERLCSSPRDAA